MEAVADGGAGLAARFAAVAGLAGLAVGDVAGFLDSVHAGLPSEIAGAFVDVAIALAGLVVQAVQDCSAVSSPVA